MAKTPKTFRLRNTSIGLMELISNKIEMNNTEIVEKAIYELATSILTPEEMMQNYFDIEKEEFDKEIMKKRK